MNKIIINSNSLLISAHNAIKQKKYLEAKRILEKAVTVYPDIFEGNHNLAILNLQLGNIDDSIIYFEKSKKIKPNYSKVYFNLAIAYDRANNLDLSLTNFKKASQLEPNNSLAYYNIGLIFKKKLELSKAEENFKISLKLNPNLKLAYTELFSLYETSNQLEKYSSLLESAKIIFDDKNLLNYYWGIYYYHKKNYSKSIELLENLDLKKENFHQNLTKHNLLGKCYDRINNFDKAYINFKKNNELVNHYYGKNIDENIYIKYVNDRINFFKNFEVENWKLSEIKNKSSTPIFLVGFPRSGTTLLDTIIRTNNTSEVIEEKPILRNFLQKIEKKMGKDLNKLSDLNENDIYEMQNFYLNERKVFQKNKRAETVIDKMPLNIAHVGEIVRFFPNAKFILALRNPYDSVLSCFIQQFTLNPAMKNFLTIESSALLYDLVMKLWKIYVSKLSINYHVIKYEDTVQDFENTTKSLFKFLDLEWTNEIKNFHLTARKRLDISTPSHDQVISPLYTRSLSRWKNYEKQFEGVKKILNTWVEEFKY